MTEEARKARNAYQREYRRKNKEKLAAYNKEWNQKHPEKRKEYAERFWERRAAEMEQKTGSRESKSINSNVSKC